MKHDKPIWVQAGNEHTTDVGWCRLAVNEHPYNNGVGPSASWVVTNTAGTVIVGGRERSELSFCQTIASFDYDKKAYLAALDRFHSEKYIDVLELNKAAALNAARQLTGHLVIADYRVEQEPDK